MALSPLACTVRGCGLALERRPSAFVCANGHTYDVARSGYVNLLQPQDRRSLAAGDSKATVEARARLLAARVGTAVLEAFVECAIALDRAGEGVVVDLGSGAGDALAAVAERRGMPGIGIDLSTAAAEVAARKFPSQTWIVANADRRLPLLDRSVALVLSLNARRHAAECARVLTPSGFLLVAVPAPDDLIELRHLIQGRAIERDRTPAVLAEHEPYFTLKARAVARERQPLSRESVLDLLRVSYRGARRRDAARIEAMQAMDVTLASDLLCFASNGQQPAPTSGRSARGSRPVDPP